MKERSRRISLSLGAALCVGLWAAACDLNPQPLPPGFNGSDAPGNTALDSGASASEDAGGFGGKPSDAGAVPPAADGGTGPGDAAAPDTGAPGDASTDASNEGAADAGDAGDGGDAGDAAGDAGQGDE